MTTDESSALVLALHTTTPELGLSMCNIVTGKQHTKVWELGRGLSAKLHQYLADFIEPYSWASVMAMGVAKGPGGFTGTRLGVVTARTLAQQLDIPLYGISTLAAIAFRAARKQQGEIVGVTLPARHGNVYGAIYEITKSGVSSKVQDQLFTPEAWAIACGDYPHLVIVTPPATLGQTVEQVRMLTYGQWQAQADGAWGNVVPFYGQHPVYQ